MVLANRILLANGKLVWQLSFASANQIWSSKSVWQTNLQSGLLCKLANHIWFGKPVWQINLLYGLAN
jgi:hypothetical protein